MVQSVITTKLPESLDEYSVVYGTFYDGEVYNPFEFIPQEELAQAILNFMPAVLNSLHFRQYKQLLDMTIKSHPPLNKNYTIDDVHDFIMKGYEDTQTSNNQTMLFMYNELYKGIAELRYEISLLGKIYENADVPDNALFYLDFKKLAESSNYNKVSFEGLYQRLCSLIQMDFRHRGKNIVYNS